MQHGTMQLEYFVPKNIDTQNAHQQDELYFITSGSSELIRDKEVISCKKGDVLFVPARMEHRFINFSNDFATWVVFYGKEGGEAEK
jgi:mannose-6-phosphate isomerase-like protein (cupin superfamily)